MSQQATQAWLKYLRGPGCEGRHPRLETKPTYVEREIFKNGERTAIVNTGGGYEHFRTTVDGEQVYASHHRLLSIAWNIPHATHGSPLLEEGNREGVIDTSEMADLDVHHAAPELPEEESNLTLGWDNREDCLTYVEHGIHSGMTQANKRAYAEDAKRLRDGQETLEDEPTCDRCGDPVKATVGETDYCIEHAKKRAKQTGETVEIR